MMRGFARVVIVEDDIQKISDPLPSGLHALGLEGESTRLEQSHHLINDTYKPDAVMIRLPDGMGEQAAFEPYMALARELKSSPATEQIPVIMVGSNRAIAQCEVMRHSIDDLMSLCDLEERLPARLRTALRLKTLVEEYMRRQSSLKEFGCELDTSARLPNAPHRFLIAAGIDGHSSFDSVDFEDIRTCALAQLDERVIDHEPDAVFVFPDTYIELAGSKLRAIRALREYATLPIVLLHPDGKPHAVFGSKPLPHGIELASDTLAPVSLIELIAARGREHRLRRWLAADIRSLTHHSVIDHATGLFTSAFFSRHVGRVIADTEDHQGALTMAMVALPELPSKQSAALLCQAGETLKNQTRAEDVLAHLGEGVMCIVFLGTVSLDAVVALSRIEKALNDLIYPLKLWPDSKVAASIVEHDMGEDVLSFIKRAQAVMV
jgi:PleD family two-component response regulator